MYLNVFNQIGEIKRKNIYSNFSFLSGKYNQQFFQRMELLAESGDGIGTHHEQKADGVLFVQEGEHQGSGYFIISGNWFILI